MILSNSAYLRLDWAFILLAISSVTLAINLFACSSNPSASGVFDTLQASSASDASEVSGIFESEDGRLSSEDLCYNNKSCVKLCDSMLKDFSDQKECYSYKEVDVQGLRDTYNKLVLASNLARVDPREMENFLEFGTSLWQDAIKGFERGWESGCTVKADDRLSKCQSDDYYLQRGYTRRGVATALAWIARNDWVAELLLDYDNDFLIMHTLLDILKEPTIPNKYNEDYNEKVDETIKNSIEEGTSTKCTKEHISKDTTKKQALFADSCLDKGFNYYFLALEHKNKDSINLANRYCKKFEKYSDCPALLKAVWEEDYTAACNLFKSVLSISDCTDSSTTSCNELSKAIKALGGSELSCTTPSS